MQMIGGGGKVKICWGHVEFSAKVGGISNLGGHNVNKYLNMN